MTGICATITSLPCALFWGAISVSGIITGALIGIFAPLHHRAIAATMAVAAGLLLAAATVELAAEAIVMTPSLAGGFAAFMIGAIGFSWANSILSSVGARDRKRCGECVTQPSEASNPGSGNAIALGTAMDAIPEALVLGLTLKTHGPEAALIAAIALGNLPEAISGSAGMQAAGRSVKWILSVWGTVAVATIVLTGAGFWMAGRLSQSLTAAPYKRSKKILRFSKSGDPKLEEAYSRHFVKLGKSCANKAVRSDSLPLVDER